MTKKVDSFSLDKVHQGSSATHVADSLPDSAQTGSEIDEMFDTAMSHSPDNEFLESIHEWWETKGFLTKKQYDALCKYVGDN